MSIMSIGSSPHPTTPFPGLSEPGAPQANKPNDQNSNNAVNNAGNKAAVTTPLPSIQAATTPGTGQKVNVLA